MLLFTTCLLFLSSQALAANPDFQWETVKDFGIDGASKLGHCKYDNQTIVQLCDARVEKKYPAHGKLDVKQPTWEKCCAYFAELNCYWMENKYYCKNDDGEANDHFIRTLGYFLQNSICGLTRFIGGQPSCNKQNYLAGAAYFNKSGHTGEFISLPLSQDDKVRACFTKLEKAPGGDVMKKCVKESLDVYDKERKKVYESTVEDACCGEYSMIDCVSNAAKTICTPDELLQVGNYQRKASNALSNTICKALGPVVNSCKHQKH